MSTKNVILGAAAACLAVGSAFGSYFETATNYTVRIASGLIPVTGSVDCVASTPPAKCLVRIRTSGNSHTLIATQATVLTSGGANAAGSGATGVTLFTANS